jgi:hypothetical protein
MSGIDQFEAMVERLVEGTFSRLFAGGVRPLEVARWVNRALEDNQVVSPQGIPQAPTHYWIYLRPEEYRDLTADQPSLERDLAAHVAQLAAQASLGLSASPTVHILPRPGLGPREVLVEAKWIPPEGPELERTREMRSGDLLGDPRAWPLDGPGGCSFLIVDGRRHIELAQSVVSIGRGLDNDIILEDPRVSRRHAQLRLRFGHYVVYDLDSRGGTQVNGYPVVECVLHSGDVLSLGGAQIVYGEDRVTPARPQDLQDTPILPADSPLAD